MEYREQEKVVGDNCAFIAPLQKQTCTLLIRTRNMCSSALELVGTGIAVSNNDSRQSVRAVWTEIVNLQFKRLAKSNT
jgi:hypothetical protein